MERGKNRMFDHYHMEKMVEFEQKEKEKHARDFWKWAERFEFEKKERKKRTLDFLKRIRPERKNVSKRIEVNDH
jgi:hypothetical protein